MAGTRAGAKSLPSKFGAKWLKFRRKDRPIGPKLGPKSALRFRPNLRAKGRPSFGPQPA